MGLSSRHCLSPHVSPSCTPFFFAHYFQAPATLVMSKLALLKKPKFLYGEKLAQLGG